MQVDGFVEGREGMRVGELRSIGAGSHRSSTMYEQAMYALAIQSYLTLRKAAEAHTEPEAPASAAAAVAGSAAKAAAWSMSEVRMAAART